MNLESLHLEVARDFMKRKEYGRAFFHLVQVPVEISYNGLEELSRSISKNPKYQEMQEVINELKANYPKKETKQDGN
jgi:hypothetical protein